MLNSATGQERVPDLNRGRGRGADFKCSRGNRLGYSLDPSDRLRREAFA